MKILIVGGSGLLGSALRKQLSGPHGVTAWSHSRKAPGLIPVDIRDAAAVEEAMRAAAPDVAIHAAAYRDPDFCEKFPAEARALNVDGTRHVLEAAERIGARLIHISTDYVFDGTAPPYGEEAPLCPISVYGRTKAEAEEIVRASGRHLILRISLLYGHSGDLELQLVAKLRRDVESRREIVVDNVSLRTPTLTADVAAAVEFLLGRDVRVIHCVGPDVLTRYEMALCVARVLGLPADHLRPGEGPAPLAPRPRASLLDAGRLRSLGFSRFTPFEDGARRVLELAGSKGGP